MTTPITLRIQQQGIVRSNGYQATQWAVTVPVVVAPEVTPRATDPLSYAPLFVVDTTGPREVLRRVATLKDFVALPQAELSYFEVRSLGVPGSEFFSYARAGDTLRITTQLPHWIQTQEPYADWDFIIEEVLYRATGVVPSVAVGHYLTLTGYTLTPDDVGRWLELRGFTSPSYNGMCQILGVEGDVAVVDKSFTTNETGNTWRFPWVRVAAYPTSGREPRYFPTRETNLAWSLVRSGSSVASADGGGVTSRGADVPTLVRSVRYTELAPSLGAAADLLSATRANLARLSAEALRSGVEFETLTTVTEEA